MADDSKVFETNDSQGRRKWKYAEDLVVGDIVRCRSDADDPYRPIVRIMPYNGRLKHIVFAVAIYDERKGYGGHGFSLTRGQPWQVL